MDLKIPKLDIKEAEYIRFTLFDLPTLNYLCVFIRDPKNPDVYWLRKFEVLHVLTKFHKEDSYKFQFY